MIIRHGVRGTVLKWIYCFDVHGDLYFQISCFDFLNFFILAMSNFFFTLGYHTSKSRSKKGESYLPKLSVGTTTHIVDEQVKITTHREVMYRPYRRGVTVN